MYYHSMQMIILVQVTYTLFSIEAYKDDVATLVHETHYYIFDDRTYDTPFRTTLAVVTILGEDSWNSLRFQQWLL